MTIDYTTVIRNFFEPKLGYFGFKLTEEEPNFLLGIYEFNRQYWGASQSIIISRVEYNKEELEEAVRGGDTPTRVSPQASSAEELNSPVWLSNKYIQVTVSHNHGFMSILSDGAGIGVEYKQISAGKSRECESEKEEPQKRPEWWKFSDITTLKLKLNEINERIIKDGLNWFERQVADIRCYHDKLDARRIAAIKKYDNTES
jgi:hypothetical protein